MRLSGCTLSKNLFWIVDTQKNYNSRDREAPETLSASAQLGHV